MFKIGHLTTPPLLHARKAALTILLLTTIGSTVLHAQIHPLVACSITGTSPVEQGQTFTYTLNGSCSATGWTVTCGTIESQTSTTVTVYFSQTGCSAATITATGTTASPKSVTVNTPPAIVPGTISPASQTLNYGVTPSQLTLSGVSGGLNSYSYQWQSSTSSSFTSPTPISGATSTTYTPPATIGTTYYRVVVSSGIYSANSSVATVTVYPQVVAGGATPTSQSINYDAAAGVLTCGAASGGNLTYSYQWQSSPTYTFTSPTTISGATSLTYSPGSLTATTYYRLAVTSNSSAPVYSNIVSVIVYPPLVGGTISSESTFYGTAPPPLGDAGISGGSGVYSYQWQSSPDNTNWTNINLATAATYTPPALVTTYYRLVVTSNGVSANSTSALVTVHLQPGIISPGAITIASGTSPGMLTVTPAQGQECSGSFSYQWQSAPDNATWTNIGSATGLNYSPGNLTTGIYYRVQASCGTDVEYTASAQVSIGTVPTNLNFIRTRTLVKPGVTDTVTADGLTAPTDVQQGTAYFDGLGRSIQTVAMQASPLLNDMVTIQVYDPFGRQATSYLPYTSPSANGNYKTDPLGEQSTFNSTMFPNDQFYYAQTNYEPSPLNRTAESLSAGNSWIGSDRGVTQQYLVNGVSDTVQDWVISSVPESLPVSTGTYSSGTLYKNISTDEEGHQVVQYTDLQGHVLLKKVQLWSAPAAGPSGWLNTYYVYDTLSNLRFVIPPAGVQWLQANGWSFSASGGTQVAANLCFRYEYDFRKRMIIKKVPGAGEAWMVYDGRDRLVMTQDSNLRVLGKWLTDQYDVENRPDSTGLLTDPNNRTYHQNLAANSSDYPSTTGGNYEWLTRTYYDNYSWVTPATSLLNYIGDYVGTSSFITTYNTSPLYAQMVGVFYNNRGMVTGHMTKVLGTTSTYLYSNIFYDDHSRTIQTQSINYSGGVDTLTNQYDFSGKPLRVRLDHKNIDNSGQDYLVVTKLAYDPAFRLKSIYKNINSTASDQLIDSMQYNELGQLRATYLGNNVDSLVYTYNIRGWLTGINPNYVAGSSTNYFGMELGYDRTTSVAPGNTYTTPEYNGNIEGTVWKTAGSGVNRKYDFSYDEVNRLAGGNFNQYNGSSFDKSAGIDFSVNGLNYDANGNILAMRQIGFKVGGSTPIDVLTYGYGSIPTNQLQQVADSVNNDTTLLGDFHFNPATKQLTDYAYDGNGNLHSDNNKAIDSIGYNYLNLPQYVHMKGKGKIVYTYDADGTRWKKTIIDSLAKDTTIILYMDGFVYQHKDSFVNAGGGLDTLQFMSHEEGRARWAAQKSTTTGLIGYSFQYDFFEKDHLGNTRMVLTQERDTTNYLASMEAAYRSTESQLFGNIASTCVAWTSVPNYQNIPNGTRTGITNPNDSVSKVDYTGTGGQTTGPSLLLKVMSGDTVTMGVQSFYNSNSATTTNSSLTSVLNSLASGLLGTPTGAAEGGLSGYTSSTGPVYGAISSFLSIKDTARTTNYPKAYLNWIFLDDQFTYISSSSGAVPAASSNYPAGQLNPVAPGGPVVMPRNGYLYVWVSNETQGWDVFFDNLSVQYKQGPILEENHYYPFGLTMAGISDKAIKTQYAENKYRYNDGTELQNKEFSDGTGLETYATDNRMYDCQLGRFWQIDPDADGNENFSPYAFANDNPILLNDPLGTDTTCPGCMQQAIVTPSNNSDGVGLADTKGGAPNVDAGPAPTSVPDPIQNSTAVTADPSSDVPSSTATFGLTLIALGEGAGEITVTGLGSIPVVVGAAAGIGLMGLQEWSRPKNYHEPTHVPTGDISIGIPRPYIPLNFHPSAGGGGTGITAPCPYPQNPALPPIPGWQWKGKAGSAPGSNEGNWVNPNNKREYLRPDVDHPDPIGPHWDWKAPDGKEYRYYPDGRLEPKNK